MAERHVRYNSRRSERNPHCMEWFFLIINDRREMPSIIKTIYGLFAPIVEEGRTYEGHFKSGSLKYKLINFDSENNLDIGWKSKIYKRVIKDRDLYNRLNDPDALEKYICSLGK